MWVEDGLLQKSDVEGWSFPATVVDYDAIIRHKHGLLDRIWSYSSSTCQELRDAFKEFRQAPSSPLAGRLRLVPGPEGAAQRGPLLTTSLREPRT